MFDEGKFKFWYGAGGKFILRNDKTLPVYNIWYLETDNLTNIPLRGKEILYTNSDEHGLGRPNVLKDNKQFKMFYGLALEKNLISRLYGINDGELEQARLKLGCIKYNRFGSEMMAYPCVIKVGDRTFMFYNGNDYGRYGFGYAELVG